MASGLARGAKARGKRIAFGDKRNIIFSQWSSTVFRNNPNIAHPGDETASDVEWIDFYKGNRRYNSLHSSHTKWVWNMDFRPTPGELFFSPDELAFANKIKPGFVLVEPNLPRHKSVARNKDWGASRYYTVVSELVKKGHRVLQFDYDSVQVRCPGAVLVRTPSVRHALATLAKASLYIGPEGGLHHGAAAVGIPGVVLFGGFIPPTVTGYDTHINLTGDTKACGSLDPCPHCRAAMDKISVRDVLDAADRVLNATVDRNLSVGV